GLGERLGVVVAGVARIGQDGDEGVVPRGVGVVPAVIEGCFVADLVRLRSLDRGPTALGEVLDGGDLRLRLDGGIGGGVLAHVDQQALAVHAPVARAARGGEAGAIGDLVKAQSGGGDEVICFGVPLCLSGQGVGDDDVLAELEVRL